MRRKRANTIRDSLSQFPNVSCVLCRFRGACVVLDRSLSLLICCSTNRARVHTLPLNSMRGPSARSCDIGVSG